jgi:hypothetical protein
LLLNWGVAPRVLTPGREITIVAAFKSKLSAIQLHLGASNANLHGTVAEASLFAFLFLIAITSVSQAVAHRRSQRLAVQIARRAIELAQVARVKAKLQSLVVAGGG